MRASLDLGLELPPAPPPVDPVAACDHLADAAAVCAAMLGGGDPVYDDGVFRISGARNVPGPRQPPGVPVLVAAPPEVAAGALADARPGGYEAAGASLLGAH